MQTCIVSCARPGTTMISVDVLPFISRRRTRGSWSLGVMQALS